MTTSELVRHLARELRISKTELQFHADKLEEAGMLAGDDISRSVVLMIAAATGDGEGGIVDRVKARMDMNMAETDTTSKEGEETMRRSSTAGYIAKSAADDDARKTLCRPFGKYVRDMVWKQADGQLHDGGIVSISISRTRPVGIVELACRTKYMDGVGTTLFADISKSVFETGETAHIPELTPGMETVTTINGAVVDALAVLIRADKAQAA